MSTRHPPSISLKRRFATLADGFSLTLSGCAGSPLAPFSLDMPPLVLAPVAQAGGNDQRGRFREIYCAVLQARAGKFPTCARATMR